MKIVLIGPPGVGKGTQGALLSDHINLPIISTGQMIRDFIGGNHPRAESLKNIVSSGGLVSDQEMFEILEHRIAIADCKKGYILDGFPRTMNQAELLNANKIKIDWVVMFALSDEEIVARLSGRLYHPGSGRVYHEKFCPPKNQGQDDVTGEPLVVRADDHPDSIKKRLALYHKETSPLVEYYKAQAQQRLVHFESIDALGSVAEIQQSLQLLF